MALTQNSDIELKGVQFQAFFVILGQIKGRVEWCMVTREAWRPKVGGGAGPCPMAGIIRAVPEVIPTIFAHFCSAQRVSAFTANELDPMGGLCRVANSVSGSVCCPPCPP